MGGRRWTAYIALALVVSLMFSWAVSAQEQTPVGLASFGAPKIPDKAPTRKSVPASPNLGFIAPELDLSHIGQHSPSKFGLQQALPSHLDWREQGKVSSVRNQGGCGSCYAFAAVANVEAKLLMDGAGAFDLSENNTKECNWEELSDYHSGSYYWGSCSGGNYEMLANLFTLKGVVLESCDPYSPSDVLCKSSCATAKTLLGWNMISDGWVPSPDVLKSYIMAYGPVYTTLYASFAGFAAYDGSYTMYYNGTQPPNHAVLIVGWDDSLLHAGGQGAWIVKNSWGANWGGSCGYGSGAGFFTIAYGSANIGMFSSYAAEWQNYDAGGGLMYYDEAGAWRGAYGFGTTGWGLAEFVPSRNSYVSRVEFWTTDATTDVDVYIYDSFDGTSLGALRWSLLNLSFAEAGYHSVPLQPALAVYSGNDVTAVVKFTNASYLYPVPVDPVGATQVGRTFMSFSGAAGTWYDMQGNDVGIRLRTSDGASGPTATPTATSVSSATSTATRTATSTATSTATRTSVPTSTATPSGGETTVTLQQGSDGYSGAQDTYVDQYNAGSNYAWADSLKVGYKQTTAGLLSFDVSSIPAGASITSAVLQMYASGWGGSNISIGTYGVVRGTVIGQATWSQASSGQAWGLPGCNDTSTDRRGTAESALTTSGVNRWYSFDVRSLVQSWVDGTLENNGVLLRQTSPAALSFSFAGAQKADGSLRPKLIVTYQGGGSPLPTATPTATTLASATPTATATDVSVPTETATSTATRTATSTATSTATRTSVPTSTATPSGSETTVTLQQGSDGYSGAQDTYVDQYNAGSNYAWADSLKVGYKQTTAGLLSFDVSSIPAGASITSAVLQVYATGWGGSNISIGTYGVVRGTVIGQATWSQASSGQAWGLPGCNDTSTDRRGTAESALTTSGVNRWYSFDVRSLVQNWVDGTLENNGVLLRQTTTAAYSFSFAGAQKADGSLRPKLIVTYQGGGSPLPTATATDVSVPTETATPTATATATSTATSTSTPTATLLPTMAPTASGVETTVTLQQGNGGYAGGEDTYLDQYNATSNYSWADTFKVGYKQTMAGLLRFDVSSIPQNASVVSALLQVYATGWGGSNINIGAYGVVRGTVVGQATWSQASSGQAWGLPGCNDTSTDRRGTAESTLITSGVNRWYGFDVLSLVQSWVDGTLENNGVLLRQTTTAAYNFNFASARRADATARPKLVVTYR